DAQHPLDLTRWPSLEAQVAALADDIAYDNHDIDDGLRSGILALDDLLDVPFIRASWSGVRVALPDAPMALQMRELIRDMIGAMVNDLIAHSRAVLAAANIDSVEDVRAAGGALIAFSAPMAAAERALKTMLYSRLYRAPQVLTLAERAWEVTRGLYDLYAANPAHLPADWHAALPEAQPERARHIADFIAGMTDRYAIARYENFIGPSGFSSGF
ncbi:MAG: deoxyguanosinetriphosphate triphosphohydrolase, partial [Alphaproteobacteria bacterium]|nr:deoxyguanosinetriphosphate triphosphohydrolase [Alphaproteobacteria bacterium]